MPHVARVMDSHPDVGSYPIIREILWSVYVISSKLIVSTDASNMCARLVIILRILLFIIIVQIWPSTINHSSKERIHGIMFVGSLQCSLSVV